MRCGAGGYYICVCIHLRKRFMHFLSPSQKGQIVCFARCLEAVHVLPQTVRPAEKPEKIVEPLFPFGPWLEFRWSMFMRVQVGM